jgi:hypothetical protein
VLRGRLKLPRLLLKDHCSTLYVPCSASPFSLFGALRNFEAKLLFSRRVSVARPVPKWLKPAKLPVFSLETRNFAHGDGFAATAASAIQSPESGNVQSRRESRVIPGLWRANLAAETGNLIFLANSGREPSPCLRSRFQNVRIGVSRTRNARARLLCATGYPGAFASMPSRRDRHSRMIRSRSGSTGCRSGGFISFGWLHP